MESDLQARLEQIAELVLDGTILGVGSAETVREAKDLIDHLLAELARTNEALRDPAAVHVNKLRGGIAKPSARNIWHLYGEKALIAEAPEHIRSALQPAETPEEEL